MTLKLTLLFSFLSFYCSLLKQFSCSTQQCGKAWLAQNLNPTPNFAFKAYQYIFTCQ